MASVKAILYKYKTLSDDTHPIVLSVIKDRKRRLISLGYSAKENQWNFEGNTVRKNHPLSDEIKDSIKKQKLQVERVIIKLNDTGNPYMVDDIVERIKSNGDSSSFKEYTEELIRKLKEVNRDGYASSHKDVLNAILKFNNQKDIEFKNITPRFLQKFEENLMGKGRKINTVAVYLRTLRAIYNKAIQDKIVPKKYYPFDNYKIKREKTIKRAVKRETMSEIYKLDLYDKPHLDLARDLFMFSFFNRGMNFVDIAHLRLKDIVDGRISYRRRKTKQTFTIKLLPQAQEIINKYKNDKRDDEYIFPIVKEEKEFESYKFTIRNISRYLHTIGEMVDCPITLTSYVARHSWATIAKRSGIATAVISEGLGHDSEQTTQIYLDSFEDDVLDKANEIIADL